MFPILFPSVVSFPLKRSLKEIAGEKMWHNNSGQSDVCVCVRVSAVRSTKLMGLL